MGFSFEKKSGFSTGGGFAVGKAASSGDDPLADLEYTGDLGEDTAIEFSALQKGFESRAKAERDRFQNAVDTEFWFAVCFKTRADKENFLKQARINKRLMGDKYIDGHKWGQMLGFDGL